MTSANYYSIKVVFKFSDFRILSLLSAASKLGATSAVRGFDNNNFVNLCRWLPLSSTFQFFVFDDVLYRQIDGVAMGSPI